MADGYPSQPIEFDEHGVARFRRNKVVKYLLDHGGLDMNALGIAAQTLGFPDEDQAQFAQLIGYSVSGWGGLDYVPGEAADAAQEIVERLLAAKEG